MSFQRCQVQRAVAPPMLPLLPLLSRASTTARQSFGLMSRKYVTPRAARTGSITSGDFHSRSYAAIAYEATSWAWSPNE
jgi:hypothetical protein